MIDLTFFYFFAALAVAAAALVVTRRNVVHSAIALITTLLATAGIYLQLRAEFLFAVQIILYVGGIMVLFLFVIMLVNLDVTFRQEQFSRQGWLGLLLAIVLAAQLGLALTVGQAALNLPRPHKGGLQPNTEMVGQALFKNHLLPFEIASILLIVAMIGAVVMTRRRT